MSPNTRFVILRFAQNLVKSPAQPNARCFTTLTSAPSDVDLKVQHDKTLLRTTADKFLQLQ